MKDGDRIRVYSNTMARDAASGILFTVKRGTLGEILTMRDERYGGCARVKLEDAGVVRDQELLVQYDALELAPGYATPVS